MVYNLSRHLSTLGDEELLQESRSSYPKWSTMCVLRRAGMATLDALFVAPETPAGVISEAAERFASCHQAKSLLVRSDGGLERANYYVGGSSFDLTQAIAEAAKLTGAGRAVLFTTPTNRFTNTLSLNLLIARQGGLIIEMLGPGFDVSDLNRGGILPEVVVRANASWSTYERLRCADIAVNRYSNAVDRQIREQSRLERIAKHYLPRQLSMPSTTTFMADDAALWLKSLGYMGLWEDWQPPTRARDVRSFYDGAWLAARTYGKPDWSTLCISASKMADGPIIFWDIVNGAAKFGRN